MKDQTTRVLSEVSSRGFTIDRYNPEVYIPLTARCDNAPLILKNRVLTQRDSQICLQFFGFFPGILPDRSVGKHALEILECGDDLCVLSSHPRVDVRMIFVPKVAECKRCRGEVSADRQPEYGICPFLCHFFDHVSYFVDSDYINNMGTQHITRNT